MKTRKKIIESHGFYSFEITPSLIRERPIFFLLSLLITMILSINLYETLFNFETTNYIDILSLFTFCISTTLTIWYFLEKIYKLPKRRWIEKLKKIEKVISDKMKGLIKEKQKYSEAYFFIEIEKVKAQKVRALLFNFYDLTDEIKKVIESDDRSIMILFEKRLKNEMLLMLKKEMNNTDIKLSKQIDKSVSLNKMVHELGFSLKEK